jgi:hypothetical protein
MEEGLALEMVRKSVPSLQEVLTVATTRAQPESRMRYRLKLFAWMCEMLKFRSRHTGR